MTHAQYKERRLKTNSKKLNAVLSPWKSPDSNDTASTSPSRVEVVSFAASRTRSVTFIKDHTSSPAGHQRLTDQNVHAPSTCSLGERITKRRNRNERMRDQAKLDGTQLVTEARAGGRFED